MEGAQRLSPLLSPPPPPPCPGPGGHRGGTGSALPSAALRTPLGSAPLRSARLRAAFPGAAPPPDPSAPAAPRPAWGGSVGPGRGQPCPVLPGDARGCSVLPGAAHRARASRCYPVPPGAARVLPGDARGCPVLPTLLRPPCPSSPAMPPQLSTALGAAAPSQKSSRPGCAGFCSSDRCWHGEGCPKPASSVPRVCSRSRFLMLVQGAQHLQGHWEGGTG